MFQRQALVITTLTAALLFSGVASAQSAGAERTNTATMLLRPTSSAQTASPAPRISVGRLRLPVAPWVTLQMPSWLPNAPRSPAPTQAAPKPPRVEPTSSDQSPARTPSVVRGFTSLFRGASKVAREVSGAVDWQDLKKAAELSGDVMAGALQAGAQAEGSPTGQGR